MRADPDHYDARIAGWWVWGISCWIGAGWCDSEKYGRNQSTRPALNKPSRQIPDISGDSGASGNGVHRRRPQFGGRNQIGHGIHQGRPQLADAFSRGRGVHGNDNLDEDSAREQWLTEWFSALRDRLRCVRVCCGDWLRVCDSPSVTTRLGVTGVFLDPPYPTEVKGKRSRESKIYASDSSEGKTTAQLRDEILEYCDNRGGDPKMRIAVCGYEGDGYEILEKEGWQVVAWKSSGYGNRSAKGRANSERERIWFSPHCEFERTLFDKVEGHG